MTAFFTPFGIYRYTSLPMGYAASQDIFTDRFGGAMDDAVQARVTEDCLITATDRQMFLKRLDRFFSRCKENGIILNTKKFQIESEVIFGGFKLNSEGYSLDPSLHDSIRKFPPPTNLTELRSFMGLINQTTTFTDTRLPSLHHLSRTCSRRELNLFGHQRIKKHSRKQEQSCPIPNNLLTLIIGNGQDFIQTRHG